MGHGDHSHFLVMPFLLSSAPLSTRLFITNQMFLERIVLIKLKCLKVIQDSCNRQCQSADGPQTWVQVGFAWPWDPKKSFERGKNICRNYLPILSSGFLICQLDIDKLTLNYQNNFKTLGRRTLTMSYQRNQRPTLRASFDLKLNFSDQPRFTASWPE